jgi:hypothetical protein
MMRMIKGRHIWQKNTGSRSSRLAVNILLALICSLPVQSQFVELRTELDTNQIRIGEQFHLDIAVWQPAGIRIVFPEIRDTLMAGVEVMQAFPRDTTPEGENLKISQRYRLTSFDSGFYEIPPMKFDIHSDQWRDSIESNPMYLLVQTVAVDSTIYDVKAPIHMPVSFLEVFPFVAGGLVLVAAVYFTVRYLKRRKKQKGMFTPERPQDPAHVIALRELDRLREEKLWQKSEFKPYYTRLTDIIRHYMERRYSIPAMEMTSHEILDTWKQGEQPDEDLASKLNRLLNLADLVKFAKEKPLASDNEENLDRAYEFVKRTVWIQKIEEEENV